jgi:putative tricarboxylic transport membrane protein
VKVLSDMRGIRINQDFVSGLMFAGWGVAGLWIARDYPMGSALRMGPGYVPRMLCWGLIALGAIIAIKGAMVAGEKITRWHWRPLLVVSIAVLAFAYLLEPGGIVAATFAIVLIGAFGGPEFRLIEVLILAAGLAIGATFIFIYGLKLPMPIWPAFLS